MKKMKNKWQSRVLACALAAALTAGTAVMTPIADFVGTNTIASAATYTDEVEVSQLQKGDILKAGAFLYQDMGSFTVYDDENSNKIVDGKCEWNVDKDYTINSITYDEERWRHTIHVTSATSAPKLAQGLIINSGDTVDFTGQWYISDDEYNSKNCVEGVYTITCGSYDVGQYCFLVGNKATYVTSSYIGTDVALKVNGGDGTKDKPFTFEVVKASSTSYTVTWMDGTTLLCTSSVAEGESPVYNGETPTNDSGTFIGWKDENNTFYANGTALPNITADTTYTAVFEKTLAVGTKYYIGDIFNTNGSKYVMYNVYNSTHSFNNRAVVSTPTYHKAENYWYFADMIREGWGFSLVDNAFNGTETVKGFRCVSGDGSSSSTAFKFEPIYENETNTCEMDFSDVETSIVSIKDADENTVSLNNGKVTIKTGYVITSSKPLSFPRTYAVQQDDESNFVYVIKNMIQSDKQVSYDTSAFKGKVTSYIGGVIVEGYKGTSAQLVQKGAAYYGKSVSMDLSHGTRLIGQNDYYDAPLDEFFDIYNSDGKNITDLFEFSNMAVSGYANYYYYKLKQNLEDDITVFPVGTKFTLTLPEDVTLENADDIVTAKEGNKYTVRPVATAVLVSDSILSVVSSEDYLVVEPDAYKKVVNGKYVYEIDVVNEFTVNKSNIITTQKEFNNAKTGDIVMPVEKLDVYTAGYRDITYNEYFNTSGYYWEGNGSGGSVDDTDYAYKIDETLSIKFNGTHEAYPVNVGKHENEEDYNVEYDKGNAWLITASNKDGEYSRRLELRGFNLALDECEFTWADNGKSATVTFNNEEPVDAVVELTPDYENKQFLCTATAEYNGIPYIETTTVSFPDLAGVANIAVDSIVIGDDMPTVTVTDTTTDAVLVPDVDYTVEYPESVSVGTATVTVTAKDGSAYIGSVTKEFVVLSRALTASISERQNVGKNVKVTITGSWCVPADAVMKDCGISRLHVNKGDEKYATKECVYELGIKKSPAVKSKNAKMSYSLSMSQTAAKKTICAVAYAVYEIDDTEFVSISNVFTA